MVMRAVGGNLGMKVRPVLKLSAARGERSVAGRLSGLCVYFFSALVQNRAVFIHGDVRRAEKLQWSPRPA